VAAPEEEIAGEPEPDAPPSDGETTEKSPSTEADDEGGPQAPAGEAPAAPGREPTVKPEIPGADLEVDIVPEGGDPLALEGAVEEIEAEEPPPVVEEAPAEEREPEEPRTVARAAIDLASGARYTATGKRKTSVARVILRPGSGEYQVNGRPLDTHFPRPTLQRNIRQPLETVGYESRMDVVASIHGGGVAAQAGALRHGIARALIEADPNLRGELKRRGFLTRDSRAKERKKAGLKKARKRPQFSKR
jgi:small subunit ribosomal protein S9